MKQAYVTLQIDTTKAQALDKMVLICYGFQQLGYFSIWQIVKQPGKGGKKRLGDVGVAHSPRSSDFIWTSFFTLDISWRIFSLSK